MQNPDQTQITYKAGQTWLTWAKCDQIDLNDPTWLQRWLLLLSHLILFHTSFMLNEFTPGLSPSLL